MMRTVSSTQVNFYSLNSRFGRLNEINNILSSSIGTQIGDEIVRENLHSLMAPAVPTDAELRNGYTITATRNVLNEGVVYVYEVTQAGEIRQVLP
ncbi:MAG: hypothetical protein IPG22_06125 [Acidobacteria bacterium]|nr:hypothetical protein [Acidobacteriota bacterium]